MSYRHILFDADNTLFDFTESSIYAFDDTLRHYGVEDAESKYEIYRPINADVWARLESKEIDMDGVRRIRWEKFWSALGVQHDPLETNSYYLSRLVEHCFLLDDTIEILEFLSKQPSVNMHIITNGMKEAQRPRIAKLGLEKYFQSITVSDEIGVAKPDPAFFDHTFSLLLTAEKSDCLVVGDSLHSDIQGGIKYGLDTCWLNPKEKENNTAFKPTYEIKSLLELKEIIN